MLLYHGTFAINSLAHAIGKQRYVTADDSRNNWLLALITLGEGWHNNHHHYQSSARQGFRWWEIDITFYVLKMLSWTRLIKDLRAPPVEVIRDERPLRCGIAESVAQHLAHSFSIEKIREQTRECWDNSLNLKELSQRAQEAWCHSPSLKEMRQQNLDIWLEVVERIGELHLPQIPTLNELKRRARESYADSPSIDSIAARAHQIIVEAVSVEFFEYVRPTMATG